MILRRISHFEQAASRSFCISSRLLLALILIILIRPFPAVAADEEEDLVERNVIFSVPPEVEEWREEVAATAGFSLTAGLNAFVGHDDNVHRSDTLLEKSSQAWGDWLYLRGDKRFSEDIRWLSTFNWRQVNYKSESQANYRRGHLSNWVEASVADNIEIEFDVDVSAENDDNTRIDGVNYPRDYSYWRYAGDTRLTWRLTSVHRLRIGAEFVRKDYGEVDGLNSIDWSQVSVSLRYRLRFAAYHYFRVWYELSWRDYDEEPANDLFGDDDNPDYPAEEHRYREFTVRYSIPVANRFGFHLQFRYLTKDDLFRGYESWQEAQYDLWMTANISDRLQMAVSGEYREREFDHMLGNDNRLLHFERWQISSSARAGLARFLWLVGEITAYKRDSNRDTETIYRDYEGMVYSVGISFFY